MYKHERAAMSNIKAMQEHAREKAELHQQKALQEAEAVRDASFTGMSSTNTPRKRSLQEKRAHRDSTFAQLFQEMVTNIVSKAAPQGSGEVVRTRMNAFPAGITDVPQYDQSLVRNLALGNLNGNVTANKLATAAISTVVDHQGGTKKYDDVGISASTTVIDTLTMRGGDEGDFIKANDLITELTSTVSGNIKERAMTAISQDIKRIQDSRMFNEDVMTEGLSHLSAKRMRKEMRKEAKQPNVIRELFSLNKTLNECTLTEEDEMTNTIIDTMILEAYNALGCISKTPEEICEILRIHRNKLTTQEAEV